MGYTIKKRTAYHEAAHALTALQLGIQFLAIHLGINGWGTLTTGQRHESFGSLELDPGYIRAKMDSASGVAAMCRPASGSSPFNPSPWSASSAVNCAGTCRLKSSSVGQTDS